MISKCVLILGCCCFIAATTASIIFYDEDPSNDFNIAEDHQLVDQPHLVLVRQVRSQEGGHGRVKIHYEDTPQRGRQGSVEYDHNIYTGGNRRYKVDAYARGTRNYDANRNDVSGGIQGSFRF
ncbi:uncharacterized protein LOC128861861 [Anastrepha ludens]|uniref:uncharacterized protein LOC128861861 n=1 Tax=Anastrepha ludens TaxID=28586 RepID=UPI0023B0798A|nr:uncharacterized protein LOC128861861 [Anastrepha ludens]